MEQELHIGREVKRLDNEIHSVISSYQSKIGGGLTRMQIWIIGYIYKHGDAGVFQREIEAEFSIARSTASGILQLMEKKGYILRISQEKDARTKKVFLTDKGREIHENVMDNIRILEIRLREGIPDEDLDIFFRTLVKMRQNIEKEHSETDRRRCPC